MTGLNIRGYCSVCRNAVKGLFQAPCMQGLTAVTPVAFISTALYTSQIYAFKRIVSRAIITVRGKCWEES